MSLTTTDVQNVICETRMASSSMDFHIPYLQFAHLLTPEQAYHEREPRPEHFGRRARFQKGHRRLQQPVPARLHPTAEDRPRREEHPDQQILPRVYRQQISRPPVLTLDALVMYGLTDNDLHSTCT